jgi:serine/threonine-protein kinase
MSFVAGTRIGPYEVIGALGAGGMGEVYRARDTRLKRDVALKILPASFAGDPDRLARFQREAEVLASLNHKNIAAIHGVEEVALGDGRGRALVLELVEGETLADVIKQGPIPFPEVVTIGIQIAEALEAAHDLGIIHRDLKPANIKRRPDGTVKVLDFGLAKLLDGPAETGKDEGGNRSQPLTNLSMSPTITSPVMATGVGVLLGTAAYMSPEQAKGRAADKRSDIFSFGCVLYELAAGKRVFTGEDISDTIAAVLREEPDWSALAADTPPRLVRVLKRCLQRDRQLRFHDVGDLRLDLAEIAASPVETDAPATSTKSALLGRIAPIAVTTIVAAILTGYVLWALRPAVAVTEFRFTVPLSEDETYTSPGRHLLALSPDGKHLVYSAGNRLNLRALTQLESTPIRGTEDDGRGPFFSADGSWIVFWKNGLLLKVALTGGAPIPICEIENPMGGSWSDDGTILLGQGTLGIWRVPSAGGTPEKIISTAAGEVAASPQLLPGGEWVLFTLRPASLGWDDAQIVAQSLRTGEQRVLLRGGRDARYVSTGHLLYARAGTMLTIPLDLDQVRTIGSPVSMIEGIYDARATTAATHFALSATGTLAYIGGFDESSTGTPVWLDRNGREQGAATPMPLRLAQHPRLSPDGRRLAVIQEGDVWVHDLEGRPPIRLTHDTGHFAPVWTPDGKNLIYESNSPAALQSIPSDGSSVAAKPVSRVGHFHAHVVAHDGRTLIAVAIDNGTTGTDNDIVSMEMNENADVKPLVKTPSREGFEGAALSPDGRWLAYASSTTGQSEIWVQPYPGPGAPARVSPNGGVEPVWARSGRELYYLEGRKMMAVALDTRTRFDFKPATFLFETTAAITGQPPSYDVAADGRFLMIKPAARRADVEPMIVIVNWLEELKRRTSIQ